MEELMEIRTKATGINKEIKAVRITVRGKRTNEQEENGQE